MRTTFKKPPCHVHNSRAVQSHMGRPGGSTSVESTLQNPEGASGRGEVRGGALFTQSDHCSPEPGETKHNQRVLRESSSALSLSVLSLLPPLPLIPLFATTLHRLLQLPDGLLA